MCTFFLGTSMLELKVPTQTEKKEHYTFLLDGPKAENAGGGGCGDSGRFFVSPSTTEAFSEYFGKRLVGTAKLSSHFSSTITEDSFRSRKVSALSKDQSGEGPPGLPLRR